MKTRKPPVPAVQRGYRPSGRDYGYTNARIRGMRSRLLRQSFFDELMTSVDIGGVISTLMQTEYGPDLETRILHGRTATQVDEALRDNMVRTFKPERLEQWNFSDPYYQDEVGLLVKKAGGYESLADLDGKVIGVAQGATSRDAVQAEADKLGIKVEFLEFATYPEINAALESGRVDAFSVDKSILSGYLTDDSVILPDGFSPQDYGVATKLGTDELRDFINEMLADMQESGEMDELLAKWNLG